MDLTAVHDILLKTRYIDEEGAGNELSFPEWSQQVQDMVNTKKLGDIAFRDKDFKGAVEHYSKVRIRQPIFRKNICFYRKLDKITWPETSRDKWLNECIPKPQHQSFLNLG